MYYCTGLLEAKAFQCLPLKSHLKVVYGCIDFPMTAQNESQYDPPQVGQCPVAIGEEGIPVGCVDQVVDLSQLNC